MLKSANHISFFIFILFIGFLYTCKSTATKSILTAQTPYPEDNKTSEQKVNLGRMLFFDKFC